MWEAGDGSVQNVCLCAPGIIYVLSEFNAGVGWRAGSFATVADQMSRALASTDNAAICVSRTRISCKVALPTGGSIASEVGPSWKPVGTSGGPIRAIFRRSQAESPTTEAGGRLRRISHSIFEVFRINGIRTVAQKTLVASGPRSQSFRVSSARNIREPSRTSPGF